MHNAFNVLKNNGFLHDEGLNSLEAVQIFYSLINEQPKKPNYLLVHLLDFCQRGYDSTRYYRPVVLLVKNNKLDSSCNSTAATTHAVALEKHIFDGNTLTLVLIDSSADAGQTVIKDRAELVNVSEKINFLSSKKGSSQEQFAAYWM